MAHDLNHPPQPPSKETIARGYEQEFKSARPIVIFGVGLALALVLAYVAVLSLMWMWSGWEKAADAPVPALWQHDTSDPATWEARRLAGQPAVPGPILQPDESSQLAALRQHEQALLHSAAWIDKDQRIARVPIDIAQAWVLARQGQAPTDAAAPTPATQPASHPAMDPQEAPQ